MRYRSLTITGALALTVAAVSGGVAAESGCQDLSAADSGSIDAGQYCTDVLGVDAEFATSNAWDVPVLAPGTLILEDPDTPIGVSALLIMRGMLADGSTEAATWLEATSSVAVEASEPATVGGYDGQVLDLTVSAGEHPFLTVGEPLGRIVVRSGEYYRVWLVDLADGELLVGFAPVATGNEDWLAKADEIMNSLTLFGPLTTQSGEESVFAQPAGPFTVEAFSLGQLSFDLPTPADVLEVHPGVVLVDATGTGAGVAFMAPRQTADGEALPDAASVRAAFEASTELSAGPGASILGQDIEATIAADRGALPQLSPDPLPAAPEFVATAPPYGYDFLLDTDGGPLAVGVFANQEGDLDAAIELFDSMAATITLG